MSVIIYIVTQGVYSDRHIIGCTVDKYRAEQIARLFDEGAVSEWELEKFLHLCDDGRSLYYCDLSGIPFIQLVEQSDHDYLWFDYQQMGLNEMDDDETCFVKAFSEEQALKIANDIHAEWKAKREFL